MAAMSGASIDPSSRTPAERVIVGRREELAAIVGCVDRARAGHGQVVWIEGMAGSGKSSLVRSAIELLGAGASAWWGSADELSMDASFSLLEQYAPVDAAGPFAAGMRLLEYVDAQSGDAVLIVAEDLHWADPASRGALLTVARRLRHDNILLMVTSRPDTIGDGWERFVEQEESCLRLRLGGLDADQITELAARRGIDLTPAYAAMLREHTGGHPLYVRTVLADLNPQQLNGPATPLPAPRSLAALTVASLDGVPPESRRLAEALAVLGTRTPLVTAGNVAGVDRPAEALGPLLSSGLGRWSATEAGTPVELSHPLYRAAVYEDLSPSRRRDLHLAAAAVTRWGTSWAHRVAAADTSDEDLAVELEVGARYELGRGDLSLAATYLSWASTVSAARERAEERLLLAVRLWLIDGQTRRAETFVPQVEQCMETALRDLVLGMVMFARADAAATEHWLAGVGRLAGPRWVHADALGHLALLMTLHGRESEMVAVARTALALRPFDSVDGVGTERNVWWGLAIGVAATEGPTAGLRQLDERLAEPPEEVRPEDAELLAVRGLLRNVAGRTRDAVRDLRTSIVMARNGAGFRQLPRAHLYLASALVKAGEWDEAQSHSRTALSLMDDHHVWLREQAEGTLVPVLAARGEIAEATTIQVRTTAAAARLATTEVDDTARAGAVAIAQAIGDPRGVIAAIRPVAEGVAGYGGPVRMLLWWPAYLAARLDAGDLSGLGDDIETFARDAERLEHEATVHVATLRARLAVAENRPEDAEPYFAAAIAALTADHAVLDRALLHHQYGRFLRARGQRRPAQDQLRVAHELLAQLGAEAYLGAVADDLTGWGGRDRGRAERSPLDLTPRELDVVVLVNKGFTNKEIGGQLYISAKAVEYHLGNIYGKLGIRSRRELRDAVPTT